jgi:DNA-binding CsgD family transcriptional regulator
VLDPSDVNRITSTQKKLRVDERLLRGDLPRADGLIEAVAIGRLSPSEFAVLEDAAEGLTVSESALKRIKSPATVKGQRAAVLVKLRARNIVHAVAMMALQELRQATGSVAWPNETGHETELDGRLVTDASRGSNAQGEAMSPRCSRHPAAEIGVCNTFGADGPRVCFLCTPVGGAQPHLMTYQQATDGTALTDTAWLARRTATVSVTLTSVECQVLRHAAIGLTSAESARQLGRSAETVKTQRSRILLKLGARNLANAVSVAVTTGIVTLN